MSSGWIFDIKRFAVHDGPGIRTTVFFKGCPLRCAWCHNPESQLPGPGKIMRERKLDAMSFYEEEVIGKEISAEELAKEIELDRVFYEESAGGITFSGGEPLMQPQFLAEAMKECKRRGFHTCLDTCGHTERSTIESILDHTDLILYDLKLIDEKEHTRYTGVSNQLILDNLLWLSGKKKEVVIRVPLIPGVTDTVENLTGIADFLSGTAFSRIELIPYHRIAKGKYEKLKLPYFTVTEESRPAREVESLFKERGFSVQIS